MTGFFLDIKAAPSNFVAILVYLFWEISMLTRIIALCLSVVATSGAFAMPIDMGSNQAFDTFTMNDSANCAATYTASERKRRAAEYFTNGRAAEYMGTYSASRRFGYYTTKTDTKMVTQTLQAYWSRPGRPPSMRYNAFVVQGSNPKYTYNAFVIQENQPKYDAKGKRYVS
jgi:hypothetical protein